MLVPKEFSWNISLFSQDYSLGNKSSWNSRTTLQRLYVNHHFIIKDRRASDRILFGIKSMKNEKKCKKKSINLWNQKARDVSYDSKAKTMKETTAQRIFLDIGIPNLGFTLDQSSMDLCQRSYKTSGQHYSKDKTSGSAINSKSL